MARKPAPKKRLKALVSKLKTRALSAAQRLGRGRKAPAQPAAGKPQPKPAAKSSPAATGARRSVVRKPAHVLPSPQAAAKTPAREKAAQPAAATPLSRRSVVRKPARGPGVKPARAKTAPVKAKRAAKARPAPPATPALALVAQTPGSAAAPEISRSIEEQFTLPSGYGDHRLVLMVRDPFWLFAYWETQPEPERAVRSQLLPEEIPGLQTILRVYDVTGTAYPSAPAVRQFDIPLSGLARNWHIHTDAPGRAFVAELGLLTQTGKFLMLLRSNRVTAPRSGPSDVVDEAWLTTDEEYEQLFGAAGLGGSSPGDWSRVVSRQVSSSAAAASAHGFWGQLKAPQLKGFWCRVDADIVLHGATEPRSRVVIQDQPVAVRKDGTFSVRLALPQGKQAVTIDVTSPNGRTTRTVTPIISLAWAGQPGPGQPADGASQSAAEAAP